MGTNKKKPPARSEGATLLSPPPSVRIFVALEPADVRKQFDGLYAKVREVTVPDPFSGHLFWRGSGTLDSVAPTETTGFQGFQGEAPPHRRQIQRPHSDSGMRRSFVRRRAQGALGN